jgi:N-acetylglucosamine kinase-like BadF-type ATPase
MSDGRAPRGPLLDILASHLSLGSELDLVDVVLNRWHADRSTVASLSLQVARAAHAGDSAALAILEKAGVELATLVRTTRSRLGWQTSDPVPVSYSGGVFGEPLVRASFEHALTADGERFDLRVPLFEPVVGACLYAARLAGAPLSGAARAQLRTRAPSERNAHESSE